MWLVRPPLPEQGAAKRPVFKLLQHCCAREWLVEVCAQQGPHFFPGRENGGPASELMCLFVSGITAGNCGSLLSCFSFLQERWLCLSCTPCGHTCEHCRPKQSSSALNKPFNRSVRRGHAAGNDTWHQLRILCWGKSVDVKTTTAVLSHSVLLC